MGERGKLLSVQGGATHRAEKCILRYFDGRVAECRDCSRLEGPPASSRQRRTRRTLGQEVASALIRSTNRVCEVSRGRHSGRQERATEKRRLGGGWAQCRFRRRER